MPWSFIGALVLGVVVGIFSGLFGVGGGLVAIPVLVYVFKMDQHTAQGTSLAMLLPPTGLLAFMEYQKAGHVNWKLGFLIAGGVFIGGYFGGAWVQHLPNEILRKTFAGVLAITAIKMFLEK